MKFAQVMAGLAFGWVAAGFIHGMRDAYDQIFQESEDIRHAWARAAARTLTPDEDKKTDVQVQEALERVNQINEALAKLHPDRHLIVAERGPTGGRSVRNTDLQSPRKRDMPTHKPRPK